MTLGLLVASENANRQTEKHTNRQDSCFISIDYIFPACNHDTELVLVLDGTTRTRYGKNTLTKAEFAKVKKLTIDFVEGIESASHSSQLRAGVVINGK